MRPLGWTEQQLNVIRDGYEKGIRLFTIAAALGRKETTVQALASRMGLKHRGNGVNYRYLNTSGLTTIDIATTAPVVTLAWVPLPEHSPSYTMRRVHVE